MSDSRLLALTCQLAKASSRRDAAQALAQSLDAEALFIFVRDDELGTLVPAPGMAQTLPAEPTWRELLATCTQAGVQQGKLAYPDPNTLQPATALVMPDATVFLFIGARFSHERVSDSALPLVAAMLLAERTALTAAARASAARAEAEDANRAKDEFLAMLGHELRNPLSPIVTALQLMKLRGETSREQEIIERQITHVVGLVDDLLDISRITRGKTVLKKAPVELAQVVAKAVETASPLLEKHQHQLTIAVPRGLVLDVDEGRLAQVVANLLTNAARYTPPGGEIAVRVQRSDKGVELTVSDTGIGIDAEMLPRLFELFFQGKRSSDRADGGLGLGLALVQTLVALHGGTVSAHSEGRGRGSQFVVQLPAQLCVTVPLPAAAPIKRAPAAPTATGHLRVMVVDDNVDAVALIAEALRMHGHQVLIAHDGPTALGQVENFRPEVAVLDIGLPVMDGYELAQKLRSGPGGAALRLIATTGYGQPSDVARAKAAGFDRHLVKPVRLADLLGALIRPPTSGPPASGPTAASAER